MRAGGGLVSQAWGAETAWGQNLRLCHIDCLKRSMWPAGMAVIRRVTPEISQYFGALSACFRMNTGGRMAVSGKQGGTDRRGRRFSLSPKLDRGIGLWPASRVSRARARTLHESGVSVHSDLAPGCPAFALPHPTSPAPLGDRP